MSDEQKETQKNQMETSPTKITWSEWAQNNPISAIVISAIAMVVVSISSSFVTTKTVAQAEVKDAARAEVKQINTDLFATKQDKDEIWRHITERKAERDKQMATMLTKEVFEAYHRGDAERLDRLERKMDTLLDAYTRTPVR